MENFGIDAGPVHNDGALVCPDLGHLSQLRVPLQGGQARSLHKGGGFQYDQAGIQRRPLVSRKSPPPPPPQTCAKIPPGHIRPRITLSTNLLDTLGLGIV
jgi:hypothetical protein